MSGRFLDKTINSRIGTKRQGVIVARGFEVHFGRSRIGQAKESLSPAKMQLSVAWLDVSRLLAFGDNASKVTLCLQFHDLAFQFFEGSDCFGRRVGFRE